MWLLVLRNRAHRFMLNDKNKKRAVEQLLWEFAFSRTCKKKRKTAKSGKQRWRG